MRRLHVAVDFLQDNLKGRAGLVGLTFAIGTGLMCIFFFSLQQGISQFATVFSLGSLTAAAWLVVGSLLGFVFGIPRTLQQGQVVRDRQKNIGDEDRQRENDDTEYRPNTNLEQISDWLTKILVGVGLTQVTSIRTTVGGLSDGLALFELRTFLQNI